MRYDKSESNEKIQADIEEYLKMKFECEMNVQRSEYAVSFANKERKQAHEKLQFINIGIDDAIKELAHREYLAGDKP